MKPISTLVTFVTLFALSASLAWAQQTPFYGAHLSGSYGLYDETDTRVCSVVLTDRFNQVRETFVLDASNCPEPFASARRWELERGMDTGRHQIAFWSGGFSPAWRGTVPSPDAEQWSGEASTGQRYHLRPESDGPLAWLRGEPQARRQAEINANRVRPGDLLGLYQVSPRNGYPRDCYLTLFRGPNGGGRINVEGERCGPFIDADRFRYDQGTLYLADRHRQPVWSGVVRNQDGSLSVFGGRWTLTRLGDTLPPSGEGIDMVGLSGSWWFQEANGPSCRLTLEANGRVQPDFDCDDPGQLFARWRLEGDLLVLSDSSTLSPSDLWRGRVINFDEVEGRGTDVLVGMPPRRINRSRLVR